MILKLLPSDPMYQDYAERLAQLAALVNPACHFDVRGLDLPEAERKAAIAELMEELEEMAH